MESPTSLVGSTITGGSTITEVADVTGVSPDTLRFYERTGVLPPIGRGKGGNRRYTAHDVSRIDFVTKMRATGMPLDTIRRYCELVHEGDSTADVRRGILVAHRAAVAAQIEQLQTVAAALDYKIESYVHIGMRKPHHV
jgi:DNA-binding transcriptional MerR regulator